VLLDRFALALAIAVPAPCWAAPIVRRGLSETVSDATMIAIWLSATPTFVLPWACHGTFI
jgi:hypothetical protein